MSGLIAVQQIIEMLVSVLIMLIIIQFVIGLLFAFNVVNPSNRFLSQVYQSINSLLDPVLRTIRNVLPSTGAIDFSPLVLILALNMLLIIIDAIIYA